MIDARGAAERVARASYGRLVALLACRSRDIAAAEDALAEAFRAALETWPARGVPERPEAWLLVAARRTLGHGERHRAVRHEAAATIELLYEAMQGRSATPVPDRRLELLFVCAHPALDPAIRTPLMLQAVLGLDAAQVAAAFLTSAAAMSQRLVRAKAKIRDAGIGFEAPHARDLPGRLGSVLAAIYAAYGCGWDDAGDTADPVGLAAEAIDLGRLIVSLLPEVSEARGLLALMLHCQARAAARRDASGAFVPLDEQDTKLWSRPLMAEAEQQLHRAARAGAPGRFQTEAAIQSAHAQRALADRVPPHVFAGLYDVLARQAPSTGVTVARAAAHGEAFGAAAGLALLPPADAAVSHYQPFWAVEAHLLRSAGRVTEAVAAYDRAIDLTRDEAVRRHLGRTVSRLRGTGLAAGTR